MIYDDYQKKPQDSYIGKYTNDYENKCLLISATLGYFKQLENERCYKKITLHAKLIVKQFEHTNYLMAYSQKEELAKMRVMMKLKKLDTKKIVFLKAKVRPLDAMEDINYQLIFNRRNTWRILQRNR